MKQIKIKKNNIQTDKEKEITKWFDSNFISPLNKELSKKEDNKIDYWIAGGCITNYLLNRDGDIDIFTVSDKHADKIHCAILNMGGKLELVSKNAYNMIWNGFQIDIVFSRVYLTAQSCISEFDFTVACAGIDSDGNFLVHEDYYKDLETLSLRLNAPVNTFGTLTRLRKWFLKGFDMSMDSYLELAEALRECDEDELYYEDEVDFK